ncbi:hypothetical protein PV646_28710 [Streptomyces sp. ID05-26A]|nr:hypothetical protein [Streptomyces sp. ID05-26A]
MTEQAGMINAYVCPSQHAVWTRNADSGTTPYIIRCPAPECSREARSQMYQVPQHLEPTHEWCRPSRTSPLTPGERQHVQRGGLLLRAIKPIPGVLGAAFRRPEPRS